MGLILSLCPIFLFSVVVKVFIITLTLVSLYSFVLVGQ